MRIKIETASLTLLVMGSLEHIGNSDFGLYAKDDGQIDVRRSSEDTTYWHLISNYGGLEHDDSESDISEAQWIVEILIENDSRLMGGDTFPYILFEPDLIAA